MPRISFADSAAPLPRRSGNANWRSSDEEKAATAPPVPINFIYLSIIHLYYLTYRYPRLHTRRLRLRPFREDDATALFR